MTEPAPPSPGAPDTAENLAVTLPAGSLIAVAWGACGAVAGVWCAIGLALGRDRGFLLGGAAAAGTVATSASVAIILLRPWRPRRLAEWPFAWLAGSFVRLVLTLAGAFLIYSAPFHGLGGMWLAAAVMMAYLAALIGETRVYAATMRRYGSAPLGRSATESTPDVPGR
jgi:hypothetical protein